MKASLIERVNAVYTPPDKKRIIVTKLKCEKCGYKWHPRSTKVPRVCPNCRSYKWNIKE